MQHEFHKNTDGKAGQITVSTTPSQRSPGAMRRGFFLTIYNLCLKALLLPELYEPLDDRGGLGAGGGGEGRKTPVALAF